MFLFSLEIPPMQREQKEKKKKKEKEKNDAGNMKCTKQEKKIRKKFEDTH